jgi:hypothetical protein
LICSRIALKRCSIAYRGLVDLRNFFRQSAGGIFHALLKLWILASFSLILSIDIAPRRQVRLPLTLKALHRLTIGCQLAASFGAQPMLLHGLPCPGERSLKYRA